MLKTFVKDFHIGTIDEFSGNHVIGLFKKYCILNDKVILQTGVSGKSKISFSDLIIKLSETGKIVSKNFWKDSVDKVLFEFDESYVFLDLRLDSPRFVDDSDDAEQADNIHFSIISSSEKEFKNVIDTINNVLDFNPPVEGNVYMIIYRGNHPSISYVGKVNCEFEKDNYDKKIANYFNFIKTEFSKKEPAGRLVLLHGPAGTGKSYFIRSLISSLDMHSIYIPSNLLGRLTGPDLISSITDFYGGSKRKPLLLVIEDADSALVKRESSRNNLNSLSDMLNMSDGLLGELANLRIICTTNTEKIELDEAITRPGRLCAGVEFGKLSTEQASVVYKKITGKDKNYLKPATLAEIYFEAKDLVLEDKKEISHGNYI